MDQDRISQVFINLMDNAIKFTSEGGAIEIRTKKEDAFIKVSVSDTGIGISPENFTQIFDKFIQVKRTSGAGTQGTGLGLPISKKLIELHHGKISVESPVIDDNKGTCFTFMLPLER